MKYYVNNKEVDYIEINENSVEIRVTYLEKFNLIEAPINRIMSKLRQNKLECQIFKDLKYGIITLWLYDISDYQAILHTLNVPACAYELNAEDKIIIIDIKRLNL